MRLIYLIVIDLLLRIEMYLLKFALIICSSRISTQFTIKSWLNLIYAIVTSCPVKPDFDNRVRSLALILLLIPVHSIAASGDIISTVAGTGVRGNGGDGGAAIDAQLNEPFGLTLDNHGNIYIADRENAHIRKIDIDSGIINVVTTNGTLLRPEDVVFDGNNSIYVVDFDLSHVYKINLDTGVMIRVAGTSSNGYSGDGGLLPVQG